MLSTLEIHERRGSDQVTLALQGELDFCSGAELGVLHRAANRAGEESWTPSLTGLRPVLALTQLA